MPAGGPDRRREALDQETILTTAMTDAKMYIVPA